MLDVRRVALTPEFGVMLSPGRIDAEHARGRWRALAWPALVFPLVYEWES